MYHELKLKLCGGEHSSGTEKYFECNFDVYAARRGDPNTLDMLIRGTVGDRSPVAVFSHGRIKVTLELLPDLTS